MTYRNGAKDSHDFLFVEDDNISLPKLILTLSHLDVAVVLGIRADRTEELQRTPAVVHKHFLVEIDSIVGIHYEATELR